MKESTRLIMGDLMDRMPALACCQPALEQTFDAMKEGFEQGGVLLIAGNGGSACDAQHIAGELMKGFLKERSLEGSFMRSLEQQDPSRGQLLEHTLQQGLPCIPLTAFDALNSAFLNDRDPISSYAQHVYVLGRKQDMFLGISTSGQSENIIRAAVTARAKGMQVFGLCGADGRELKQVADICIEVPARQVSRVQELHLPVYHCLCAMLEDHFFE